jgi:DMSO/TMAO reductase YedYZ molybdopterin-dependent catalytic subunit
MCLAGSAAAQTAIDVVGLDGRKVAIVLAGLERKTVTVEDRGLKTTFEGVALSEVLARAGVPMGDQLRGKDALSRVVIASARDGYQVAYSIAEVDAAFSNQVVLLADRRDGKPLLPDTGPLQIVVPNDRRAARWIRQVTAIEVRQLK